MRAERDGHAGLGAEGFDRGDLGRRILGEPVDGDDYRQAELLQVFDVTPEI